MTNVPAIFISHIDAEYPLAQMLATWLDFSFRDQLRVVVGGRGLQKGRAWFDGLGKELQEAEMVIALCSPESVEKADWLYFEAGTAWGRDKMVLPLCHSGMAPDLLPPQFSPFQAATVDAKAKFATDLLDEIERNLNLKRSKTLDLERSANELKTTLDAIATHAKRTGLYVSIPLRALDGSDELEAHKQDVIAILQALEEHLDVGKIYFGGRRLVEGKVATPEPPYLAAEQNIPALMNAQRFLMIYPGKMATTSLSEFGIAFARSIPSVVFMKSRRDLPFGVQALSELGGLGLGGRVKTIEYDGTEQIVDTIKEFGARLFADARA